MDGVSRIDLVDGTSSDHGELTLMFKVNRKGSMNIRYFL